MKASSLQNTSDALKLTCNFEQLGAGLPQLDKNLSQIDHMSGLVDAFVDRWDMFRSKNRSDHTRLG